MHGSGQQSKRAVFEYKRAASTRAVPRAGPRAQEPARARPGRRAVPARARDQLGRAVPWAVLGLAGGVPAHRARPRFTALGGHAIDGGNFFLILEIVFAECFSRHSANPQYVCRVPTEGHSANIALPSNVSPSAVRRVQHSANTSPSVYHLSPSVLDTRRL